MTGDSAHLRPMKFTHVVAFLMILSAGAIAADRAAVPIPSGGVMESSTEDLVEAVKGFYGGESGSVS